MEIPSLVTGQLAKINVHRAAESVPTRKSLLLHALEIPKGIADILKIEVHPTPRKTRPRSAPVSEEMAAQEATEPNATSPIATELNLKWRSPYASGPCLHRSVAEVINDDLGRRRPKLMAKMITVAVMPSAMVPLMRSRLGCEALASCVRPLAILNKKTPGIRETTEAKPRAAKGMRRRRATGVMISPTMRQAAKAPIPALAPSSTSNHQRKAWANMPTATGHTIMEEGMEKFSRRPQQRRQRSRRATGARLCRPHLRATQRPAGRARAAVRSRSPPPPARRRSCARRRDGYVPG